MTPQEIETQRQPVGSCDDCGSVYWKLVKVRNDVSGGLRISVRYLIECECEHVWRRLAGE